MRSRFHTGFGTVSSVRTMRSGSTVATSGRARLAALGHGGGSGRDPATEGTKWGHVQARSQGWLPPPLNGRQSSITTPPGGDGYHRHDPTTAPVTSGQGGRLSGLALIDRGGPPQGRGRRLKTHPQIFCPPLG